MTEVLTGLLVMMLLAFVRIPIALSMGIVGIVGYAYMRDWSWHAALATAQAKIYETGRNYTVSAVPVFILMGSFVTRAGMSQELYRCAYAFIGHLRGGLAMATIVACGGFGAICGSSIATAATFAKVAYPSMKKYGYADHLSTGAIAAGGTLGILIPPSTIMVIYGIMTGTNIGKLFAAGILPGILAIALLCLAVQYLDAVPDPDRCADVRRVRQHHQHADRPDRLRHPLPVEPCTGGGRDHGDLRPARHGDGGALHDPAHGAGVLSADRAPRPRPGVVLHPDRGGGGDQPHQPAGGHESLRARDPAARSTDARRVPRRAALHDGRLLAPRDPGRLPRHLALAAELHAMKPKAHFLERVNREMEEDLPELSSSVEENLAAACRVLAREGHESGLAAQVTARARKPGTWWPLQCG